MSIFFLWEKKHKAHLASQWKYLTPNWRTTLLLVCADHRRETFFLTCHENFSKLRKQQQTKAKQKKELYAPIEREKQEWFIVKFATVLRNWAVTTRHDILHEKAADFLFCHGSCMTFPRSFPRRVCCFFGECTRWPPDDSRRVSHRSITAIGTLVNDIRVD